MKIKDLILIFAIIIIWGVNFVIIKIGLQYTSPFLFGALRYLPYLFIFFLYKRPDIPFGVLIIYGLIYYFCQFGFLFVAIALGLPAGMSSMILQSQAFFTVFMAMAYLKEPFRLHSFLGLIISALGIVIICSQNDSSVSLIGLILALMGGVCWAFGNILVKKYPHANMGDLTAWGGMISIIPFILTAIAIDGPSIILHTIENADWLFVFAVFYIFGLATVFGTVVWGSLMRKYNASSVAPFSLLVPVFGISSAAWLLNEHLSSLDIIGAIVVMLGLCINVFGTRLLVMLKKW